MQNKIASLKLSAALWGFRKMTLEEIILSCPKMGIKHLEGHLHPEVPLHFRYDMSKEELDRILRVGMDHGVKFATLATATNFTTPDGNNTSDLDWAKKTVVFANRIQVDVIRIFAGWMPREKVVGEVWDGMVKGLSQAANFAGEHGVTLALENHGGIATDAKDMLAILDAVSSPHLKLNFDPANFEHAGVDCIAAYEKIKDHVVYAHIKDVQKDGSHLEYCAAGEGCINWAKLLPMISENYDGTYAIEYEDDKDPVEGTRRSVDFLKTIASVD